MARPLYLLYIVVAYVECPAPTSAPALTLGARATLFPLLAGLGNAQHGDSAQVALPAAGLATCRGTLTCQIFPFSAPEGGIHHLAESGVPLRAFGYSAVEIVPIVVDVGVS